LNLRVSLPQSVSILKKDLLYNHFKLHFIVLIYGFTAILGKIITLPADQLVWYRMLIATITFLTLFLVTQTKFILPTKEILKLLGVGIIVGVHWITFFAALKLSNVSVTLGCLASTTLFTSILEPVFFKKRLVAVEVIIGVLIIIGLYLIFQFETKYWQGIITAITSAFLAGLFTVLNKKLVVKHRARIISFYEMLGGFIGITLYLFLAGNMSDGLMKPTGMDVIYLLILGLVCTAFAFVIQVDVMRQLTAYVVALTINLEPIYGIILAFVFFGDSELMSTGFYLGTIMILLSVFGYPVYNHFIAKHKAQLTNK
jgi:drug/metabolite transporter (DMT)-like permease